MRDSLNITAHSGCDGTEQDSPDSIRAGIRNGADAVEVDVRINSSGELVLSHDRDESGAYRGCATLAEAFELVIRDGRIGINCDVKERETIPAILDLAGRKGLGPDRLVLTGSAAPSTLRGSPEIARNAGVWLNIEEIVEDYYRIGSPALEPYRSLIGDGKHEYEILAALPSPDFLLDPIVKDCLSLGVGAVNMPYAEPLLALIPRFKAGGIQVSLWTLNKRETLARAFGLGVLNITTRDTLLALEVRGRTSQQFVALQCKKSTSTTGS
ncbi:MAG: glycerophosphodiester phosphodiesterase [Treponema sp.]|jgi:glycerophosphoryl diester phosphodiesterase|nr:glycerophosphodiester phosphodiesterase [Treponema sp.]